jgi:hypothetical protein
MRYHSLRVVWPACGADGRLELRQGIRSGHRGDGAGSGLQGCHGRQRPHSKCPPFPMPFTACVLTCQPAQKLHAWGAQPFDLFSVHPRTGPLSTGCASQRCGPPCHYPGVVERRWLYEPSERPRTSVRVASILPFLARVLTLAQCRGNLFLAPEMGRFLFLHLFACDRRHFGRRNYWFSMLSNEMPFPLVLYACTAIHHALDE